MSPDPILEWRVRYRRTGWTRGSGAKAVKFHTKGAAVAYAAKLTSGGRPDLSALEYVRVEERTTTPWQAVS